MTTINLKTKITADEPDRSKKYSNATMTSICGPSPLEYVTGRGWTWGSRGTHYSWEEFVASCQCYFPLTEVERKVTLVNTHTTYEVVDCGGDQLTLSGGPSTIVLATQREGNPGTRRNVVLGKQDAANLLEALQRIVKIES